MAKAPAALGVQWRYACSSVFCARAEVVPARLRTFIYAFDRSFEMAIAACAAPVVAKLAESIFGFDVRMSCPCTGSNHMPLLASLLSGL